jgi:hypothetical protein
MNRIIRTRARHFLCAYHPTRDNIKNILYAEFIDIFYFLSEHKMSYTLLKYCITYSQYYIHSTL